MFIHEQNLEYLHDSIHSIETHLVYIYNSFVYGIGTPLSKTIKLK
jgi:hypothetical protein